MWSLSHPRRPFVVEVLQPMSLPPSSAPTATGWSDSCRAGFAPAEEWRLVTAHRNRRLSDAGPPGRVPPQHSHLSLPPDQAHTAHERWWRYRADYCEPDTTFLIRSLNVAALQDIVGFNSGGLPAAFPLVNGYDDDAERFALLPSNQFYVFFPLKSVLVWAAKCVPQVIVSRIEDENTALIMANLVIPDTQEDVADVAFA